MYFTTLQLIILDTSSGAVHMAAITMAVALFAEHINLAVSIFDQELTISRNSSPFVLITTTLINHELPIK